MRVNAKELAAVAASMKAEIAWKGEEGKAERSLQPFYLLLLARKQTLTLHVGLRETWPLREDMEPFVEAFGVPEEDRDGEPKTHWLDSRVGGPKMAMKTMRFTWHEQLAVERTARPGQQLTFFGAADALSAGL